MRKVLLVLLILVPLIQSTAQSVEEIREQIALEFKQFSAVFPQLDSAQIHVDNAIGLCVSIQDNSLLCQALDYSGYIQYERSNYSEAVIIFRKALSLARLSGNEGRESVILNHIHLSFRNLAEIDSALFYAHEALDKRIELRDTTLIVGSYFNLASIYQILDNPEESIKYQSKIYELHKISKDSINIVNSFMALSYHYSKIGDFEKCAELIEEVVKYCSGGCSEKDNSIINYFHGIINYHSGNFEEAMEMLILAENQSKKHYKNIHADAVKQQALIYLATGDSANFVKFINRCLEISIENKQVEIQAFAYNHLYKYYQGKSDYKKALEYKLAQEAIIDSIKSSKTMWNVNKIHSDMIRKKSDEVIQEREATIAEKEKTNMLLQLSGGLALVIILGTVLSYQVIRRKNSTIRGQNQELSLYNFELQHDIADQLIELTSTRKSVDTVISRISHDVRGKVATLKLLSTLTKSDNPSVQDYLSKITATAKEADETIAGLTTLARIRSRELQPAEIKLPARMLEHFTQTSKLRENIEVFTDHILLVLIFDQMAKLMNVYGSSFRLNLDNGDLIIESDLLQLSEDSEWEEYLPSPEDFMPHVEFELMQIKVAVNRLTGKISLRSGQDGMILTIRIPPLDLASKTGSSMKGG